MRKVLFCLVVILASLSMVSIVNAGWWNASWQSRTIIRTEDKIGFNRNFEPIDIWIDFTTNPVNITKEIRLIQCNDENISYSSCDSSHKTMIPVQVYNVTTVSGTSDSANIVFLANVSAWSFREYGVYYNYTDAEEKNYGTDLNWDGSVLQNNRWKLAFSNNGTYDYYYKPYSTIISYCHHIVLTECINTMWGVTGDHDECLYEPLYTLRGGTGQVFVDIYQNCGDGRYRTFRAYYGADFFDLNMTWNKGYYRAGFTSGFNYLMNDSQWINWPPMNSHVYYSNDGDNYYAVNNSADNAGIGIYFNMKDTPKNIILASWTGIERRDFYIINSTGSTESWFFYGTIRNRYEGYKDDQSIPMVGNRTFNDPLAVIVGSEQYMMPKHVPSISPILAIVLLASLSVIGAKKIKIKPPSLLET